MNRAEGTLPKTAHLLSTTPYKSPHDAVLTKLLQRTSIRFTGSETAKSEFRVESGISRVPSVCSAAARYYEGAGSPTQAASRDCKMILCRVQSSRRARKPP